MDEGFSAYAVSLEGLSGKVDDIVTCLFFVCNDDISVAEAERVMHIKGLQVTVVFSLRVM